MRLLTGDSFAARLVQKLNVLHAVYAVQPGVRIMVRDANEIIPLIHVDHFIGTERIGLCFMLLFIQTVVEVAELDLFLLLNGLIQLLDVPEHLPIVGLAILP